MEKGGPKKKGRQKKRMGGAGIQTHPTFWEGAMKKEPARAVAITITEKVGIKTHQRHAELNREESLRRLKKV